MKRGSLQFPTFGSELFRGAIPGLSCSTRREGGTSFRPRTHAHFCVWVLIGSVCLQPLKLESVMSIVAPRVEGCAGGLKLRRGGAGFSRREGKNLAFVFVRCIQFFFVLCNVVSCVSSCVGLCVVQCRLRSVVCQVVPAFVVRGCVCSIFCVVSVILSTAVRRSFPHP